MLSVAHSLVELLSSLAGILVMAGVSLPYAQAPTRSEAHLLGAGRTFKGEFRKARSIAVRRNVQTAIRFEQTGRASTTTATYVDGNHNGVLSADIRAGVDPRIAGPLPPRRPGARRARRHQPGRARHPARHGHARSVRSRSGSARRTCCRSRRWGPRRRARSTWPARRCRRPCASRPAARACA